MNLRVRARRIRNSAGRLVEGADKMQETQDPIWGGFLKKESNLLLRRAWGFWWGLRFGERRK